MIKNCPFCDAKESEGTVKIDEIEVGIFAVCCNACKAIGPHKDGAQDRDQAVKKWNRLRGVK